jgi:hypothetical protein
MGSSIPLIDHVADQTRFEESKCAGSFIGAGLAAALLLLAAGSSGLERSTFGGFSFGGRASLSPFGIRWRRARRAERGAVRGRKV